MKNSKKNSKKKNKLEKNRKNQVLKLKKPKSEA